MNIEKLIELHNAECDELDKVYFMEDLDSFFYPFSAAECVALTSHAGFNIDDDYFYFAESFNRLFSFSTIDDVENDRFNPIDAETVAHWKETEGKWKHDLQCDWRLPMWLWSSDSMACLLRIQAVRNCRTDGRKRNGYLPKIKTDPKKDRL